MKHRVKLIIGAWLCVVGAPAFAVSGSQFLEQCKNVTASPPAGETPQQAMTRALNAGSCTGYIGGVINGMNLVGNMLIQKGGINKNFVCPPQGVQARDLLDKLIQHLASKPKDIDAPVQVHILRAFAAAYPCPEVGNKE